MEKKFTDEEMTSLTQSVISQLDTWNLSDKEMVAVLGLSETTKARHFQHFRNKDKSLEQTPETLQRIEHIVGIIDALRTAYPFSDQMRMLWLKKPHRRFRKKTPLSVILNEGINGLLKVRCELDCAYGWTINEAMRTTNQKSA
jgi:uncharacterized protein (DUF2384 family)